MKKLLFCIVTVAAFACMSGVALGGKTYSAEAFIQNGNAECGANETHDAGIGTVTFHRTGNVVRVAFDLERGAPDTTYEAFLFESSPEYCHELRVLGEFTTNNRGEGAFVGQALVPEEATKFFADPYSEVHGSSDTPTVTLP